MGEIAEAMMDGTLCAGCGEYLEKVALGFPDYCSSCKPMKPRGHIIKAMLVKKMVTPLGPKQLKRLQRVKDWTDKPAGMYPGVLLEDATAKFRSLVNVGYAELYEPHNPIHKTRVVITELGRKILEKENES